jgi:hypothetical protein
MTIAMRLSIIIVNYNVKDLLKKCLQSIEQTVKPIEYEVIVIDNCSVDGSVALIKADFPQVKIIENHENRGFAAANNQGINCSHGDYILLLNPDTIVLSNSVERMLEFIENHQQAGIVGCKILNPDGSLQSSCRNFPSLALIFFESMGLHRFFSLSKYFVKSYLRNWAHNEIRMVDSVKGACMMVRRTAIEEVGLLDENYFLYDEEVDWCKRMQEKAWDTFFIPDAQIIHYGEQSTKQEALKNMIQSYRARQQYFQKFYGKITAFTSKTIFGFGVFLRFIICIPFVLLGRDKKENQERFRLFAATLKWYFCG